MAALNHKIISAFLLVSTLALFLPLHNILAQGAPPTVEEGDENVFFGQRLQQQTSGEGQPTTPSGQTSSQPVAANESVAAALRTAACPVISNVAFYITACGLLTAGGWVVFVVLMAVSAFFALFGNLFDLVTAVTLNPATYSVPAIYQGWTVARDTANMFFIFILLTIAIATILQIETYGAKKLLPKLIAAAIFINFSFLLTQYVVFASNIMTGFFLPGAGTARGPSAQLSVMFLAGINPNAMYKNTQFNLGAIADTQKKLDETRLRLSESLAFQDESSTDAEILAAQQEFERATAEETRLSQQLTNQQKELPNTLLQLIVAMLGVIAFILVATFALGFAGISLLIRVVVLWFLMILSPIAFLFFVIPGLGGHASKWWGELLKQSFFAPAFFFLFGLTVNMISTPQARALFGIGENIAQQANAGAFNTALIVSFTSFAYYTLLIIMLIASVLVAKSMGGATAQWAEKGAKYARGAALGYAGRVGRKYAIEATGAVGKAVTSGEGRVAQVLRQTPYVNKMFGAMEATQRREVKKYEKQYGSFSTDALKNIESAPGLRVASERNAIRNIINKRDEDRRDDEILKNGDAISKMRVMDKRAKKNKADAEQAKREAEEKNPKT